MADVLIANGRIVDGTGAAPYGGWVALNGDQILAVERSGVPPPAARCVIDVAGASIAPGFIDLHTHSDLTVLGGPTAPSKVLQGVTTEVVGNCGLSPYPIATRYQAQHSALMGSVGTPLPSDPGWSNFAGYTKALHAAGLTVNVVGLVGHGALRTAVMGHDPRAATQAELAQMRRLLAEALEQGAAGLSTGLTYVPSSYGDEAEIHALAGEVARHGRLYATHSRGVAALWTGAVQEAVEVAETGARTQFSHLAINEPDRWGRSGELLDVFERAAARSLDVAFDVYPYDASCSALTQYLPSWLTAGGEDRLIARLGDRETRDRARVDLTTGWSGIRWQWDRVQVSYAPGYDAWAGRRVSQLAGELGTGPEEIVLELAAKLGNTAQVVLFYRSEADVEAFIRHPLSSIGSDGQALPMAGDGQPHPRSFGCHPRVLRRYVRERKILDEADAVQKMTSGPATRLGLSDRGVLAAGKKADLSIYRLQDIADTATFTQPRQPPEGIERVFVGGREAVVDGQISSARPGRVLSAGAG